MNTIYFTKTWTSGLLRGLSYQTSITLDKSVNALAKQFAIGSKHSDCITRDKWVVTDSSFQSYTR